MKIHKLNLENYYRNLMLDTLQMSGGKSYNRQPTYSDVAIQCNKDSQLVIGLPSLPESSVMSMNSAGQWTTTTVKYATATIVGMEPDKTIPLTGGFSLGLDRERIYWTTHNQPTLKLYTIPANVDKVKVVISFKSGHTVKKKVGNRITNVWEDLISNDSLEGCTIVIDRKDDSYSPLTVMEAEESGGSTITVDSSMSDTSENPVQNKVIYAAIAQLQAQIGTINDTLNNVLHG